MILKRLTYVLLCFVLLSNLASCSSNNDDNDVEQELRDNDQMLVGTWKSDQNGGNENKCFEISFMPDGKGRENNKVFDWYTYDGNLFIQFEDGATFESKYYLSGATLNIEDLGVFFIEIPITGTWYAADAMNCFRGGSFCYYFNKNGEGIKYSFDYMGLTSKTNFKWNRSAKGVDIIYRYHTDVKECSFTGNVMSLSDEGDYTSAPPFFGKWKAVDCEKGLIFEDDDNFSTFDITAVEKGNIFKCHYRYITENDVKDAMFQGSIKFISSHQMFYDDQQLFIIKDLSNNTDARVLEYRYFYYPQRKKVYLDLSPDFSSKKFVRYEHI